MISQYLIKYISSTGKYTNHDPDNDIFTFKGVRFNGVLFDETNIVTVSGVNSMTSALAAVSGASSHRDDLQDAANAATAAVLNAKIDSVSGASSIRDDSQDATTASNYSTLNSKIDAVSGASSHRDDVQDALLVSVSGSLESELVAIRNDRAKEERFEAVSGQTLFTLSTIVFDPDPTVHDIQGFKNGLKAHQSRTGFLAGVSGGDFVKVGTNQVQWLYGLNDGDRVILREERTGAGSGGGGADLTNVTTDIVPNVNGVRYLGSATKGFAAVRVTDMVSGSVIWDIGVSGGTIVAFRES